MKDQEKENWTILQHKIEWEGFDYCFRGYSSWKEIEDEKFQELRKKYVNSANELEAYVNSKFDELKTE